MRQVSTSALLLLLCFAFGLSDGLECDKVSLQKSVNALGRALRYMEMRKNDINLDGVYGVRYCADQLKVTLRLIKNAGFPKELIMQLQYYAKMAARTASDALPMVMLNEPHYFKIVGILLLPGTWKHNYNLRNIKHFLTVPPMKCADIDWGEQESDLCHSEILNASRKCQISDFCWKMMTMTGYKDYPLTHEILYLQTAESFGCMDAIKARLHTDLNTYHDSLCTNVMRDTQDIARHNYPNPLRDLFLEQIGVCGMLGYREFLNKTWLQKTMEWQHPNGCYMVTDPYECRDDLSTFSREHIRRKRMEKVLDDGCSSHMTSVAIFALISQIKVCIQSVLEVYVDPIRNQA